MKKIPNKLTRLSVVHIYILYILALAMRTQNRTNSKILQFTRERRCNYLIFFVRIPHADPDTQQRYK